MGVDGERFGERRPSVPDGTRARSPLASTGLDPGASRYRGEEMLWGRRPGVASRTAGAQPRFATLCGL
jgi:hypothetical protein